ncbi:hypothetical protein [Gryllotalpicola koreensis]|uniref:Sortase n=1 Tax=Gryllotalpicola koreensis TaxID=993086 RepID=A0ABP8A0F9_9MICO
MSALRRSLVPGGAAATLALALAFPLSAAATPDPYTPAKPDPWSVTIASCSTLTRQIPDHTFDDDVDLALTVSGVSAAPTVATFSASQVTSHLTSTSSGGAELNLHFGSATSGVYEVTLVEPGTEHAAYGTVTVTAACGAVDPAPAASASKLARTGTDISVGVLWGAGAAVVAGALFWVISRLRRGARSR